MATTSELAVLALFGACVMAAMALYGDSRGARNRRRSAKQAWRLITRKKRDTGKYGAGAAGGGASARDKRVG